MKYYVGFTKNNEIRLNSSSGGIFYELASEIFKKSGVVFGVAWDKNWEAHYIGIEKAEELPLLMGSKYVLAKVGDTFKQCKEALDAGRTVLYSGLPCQIHGLKKYLSNKEYPNLICVDICCHGTMSPTIWKQYLGSIQREDNPITSINMRDKRTGWKNFSFSIRYRNGEEISSIAHNNEYVKTFLCDKFLRKCCYDCKYKNQYSVADITIGDYWGVKSTPHPSDDDKGLSLIITNTDKGDNFLREIQNNINLFISDKSLAESCNGGMRNHISTQKEVWDNRFGLNKKKIGIITLYLHSNIGGVLQNYALQQAIKKIGLYECQTIEVREKVSSNLLSFAKTHINLKLYPRIEDIRPEDYDLFIVGSDQVWRERWLNSNISFLVFTKDWDDIKRITYAASTGKDVIEGGHPEMLSKFDKISVRENALCRYLQKLGFNHAAVMCDPTMLLKTSDYEELCKSINTNGRDVGVYLLDYYKETRLLRTYIKNFDHRAFIPREVETFLAMFRDCSCIITDSYHGCVFSIIFNKPFVCIKNKGRGEARFDTLSENFGVGNRFFESFNEIDYNLLNTKPNVDISKARASGIDFLRKSLEL